MSTAPDKRFHISQGLANVLEGNVMDADGTSPDLTGEDLRVVASRGEGHPRVLDSTNVTGGEGGYFKAELTPEECSMERGFYQLQLHVLDGEEVTAAYPVRLIGNLIVHPVL